MATVFTRVLGRPAEDVDIPVEFCSRSCPTFPFPVHDRTLSRAAETHQLGESETANDVVQTIGGVLPKSLEAFIRENAAAFGLRDEELSSSSQA